MESKFPPVPQTTFHNEHSENLISFQNKQIKITDVSEKSKKGHREDPEPENINRSFRASNDNISRNIMPLSRISAKSVDSDGSDHNQRGVYEN